VRSPGSSILKTVPRLFTSSLILFALNGALLLPLAAEDARPQTADKFFAGTVKESAPEKLVVGRNVRGKAETREFRVTPDTKIEGTLEADVRVTVRYISNDEGYTAVLIVVRQSSRRAGKRRGN